MANPLGIFFSRLAPEDKQFIKKIGISLTVLLILSGVGLYFFVHFGKGNIEFVMPTIPEIPHYEEILTTEELLAAKEPSADTLKGKKTSDENLPPASASQTEQDSFSEDFDSQAHLQLMKQNADKYNYKMAYKHGARIVNSLLANSKLTAEWGHILLEAGKPQEAVSVLQEISSEDSVKSELAIDMAFAMHRSGNTDGAIEFLDEKIKSNRDVNLLAAKASIIGEHPEIAKRSEAGSIFSKYAKGKKFSPKADYLYGRFLMQRGDYGISKAYLERAVKTKPNEPRYIARLGMAEFYLKRDVSAEILYKKSLEINPYDYNTWFNLGELYLSAANESTFAPEVKKKIRKALEAYSKTIENDSAHAQANYRIGIILNGNGQYKEAINHLNIALEKMPTDIPVMQQLSSAYIKMNDTTKSLSYLDTILQIDPFNKIAASELKRLRKLHERK